MNFIKKLLLIPVLLLSYIVILNSNIRVNDAGISGKFAAYRGGGQLVNYSLLNSTQCTATSIIKSRNAFIENTMPAVDNSVKLGASVIHLNVHATTDKQIVVFHDWTLNCATDGTGVVFKKSAMELANINAAYQYSWDNGNTYPFRNNDYKIQELDKFLEKHPQLEFWINIKEDDTASFSTLNDYLLAHCVDCTDRIVIFTSEKGRLWFIDNKSPFRGLSMESTKSCLKDYVLYGWSGYFPTSCNNIPILIPPDKTKFVWGYPKVFALRAQRHNSDAYLWLEHREIGEYKRVMHLGIGVASGDSAAFIDSK